MDEQEDKQENETKDVIIITINAPTAHAGAAGVKAIKQDAEDVER